MQPTSLELNDEESRFLSSMLNEQDHPTAAPSTSGRPPSSSGRPHNTLSSSSSMKIRIEELESKMGQLHASDQSTPTILMELINAYHSESMKCMESGSNKQAVAFELLQKAQILAESMPDSKARSTWLVTIYSSLAVYFQRNKKYEAALLYLEQASDLEKDTGSRDSIAGSDLNIAAVLSSLGRHSQALVHAQKAVQTLLDTDSSSFTLTDCLSIAVDLAPMPSSQIELLSKAYYSIGAIHEHLNQLHEALGAYRIASNLAFKVRDVSLSKAIDGAAQEVKRRMSRTRGRSASLKQRNEKPLQPSTTSMSRPKSAALPSSTAPSSEKSKGQNLSISSKVSRGT